jgi:curved DNA-binding protein CbpA
MDYYLVLGVNRNASESEIKDAYRRLVKQHHPDKNPSEDATAVIQLINEAYDVLSDPVKRSQYDQPVFAQFEIEEEEDPNEVYRREFIRKRAEKERAQKEADETYRRKLHTMLRYAAIVISPLVFIIAIDNYLPSRTYVEYPTIGYQRSYGRGKSDALISYMETPNFVLVVPHELHIHYDYFIYKKPLTIKASGILGVPQTISIKKGNEEKVYWVKDTIYDYHIPIHLLLLLCTFFTIYRKEYSQLTYTLCFMPPLLFSFIVLIYWYYPILN